jgi:hypothetical protein
VENKYPKFFYKYRALDAGISIENSISVQGLLKNEACLSSRLNFNDIFDSRINLIRFYPSQLLNLKSTLNESGKAFVRECIKGNNFTALGLKIGPQFEQVVNAVIDSYAFYSVSANSSSNLMWSHYANSHSGFCIEFRSEHLQASKVTYADAFPELKLIDFVSAQYDETFNGDATGQLIWNALRTKLSEWSYEEEYRFQAGDSMGRRLEPGQKYRIVAYSPNFVESIIFGCRMDLHAKRYIVKNMPFPVKYKQALIGRKGIEIVPINPKF